LVSESDFFPNRLSVSPISSLRLIFSLPSLALLSLILSQTSATAKLPATVVPAEAPAINKDAPPVAGAKVIAPIVVHKPTTMKPPMPTTAVVTAEPANFPLLFSICSEKFIP
jgi:hypothetical protein